MFPSSRPYVKVLITPVSIKTSINLIYSIMKFKKP